MLCAGINGVLQELAKVQPGVWEGLLVVFERSLSAVGGVELEVLGPDLL